MPWYVPLFFSMFNPESLLISIATKPLEKNIVLQGGNGQTGECNEMKYLFACPDSLISFGIRNLIEQNKFTEISIEYSFADRI